MKNSTNKQIGTVNPSLPPTPLPPTSLPLPPTSLPLPPTPLPLPPTSLPQPPQMPMSMSMSNIDMNNIIKEILDNYIKPMITYDIEGVNLTTNILTLIMMNISYTFTQTYNNIYFSIFNRKINPNKNQDKNKKENYNKNIVRVNDEYNNKILDDYLNNKNNNQMIEYIKKLIITKYDLKNNKKNIEPQIFILPKENNDLSDTKMFIKLSDDMKKLKEKSDENMTDTQDITSMKFLYEIKIHRGMKEYLNELEYKYNNKSLEIIDIYDDYLNNIINNKRI